MSQTATLGKQVVSGGLTWVSLSRPRDATREAIATAKRYDGDCYVVRTGLGAAQVGIGRSSEGIPAKAISFAAYMANLVAAREDLIPGKTQRINDWLGVFQLSESAYGFVAVREGAILPTGDFIGTLDEAIEQLEHNYGVGGWAAVFGPDEIASIGYHCFVQVALSDLVAFKNGEPTNTKKYAIKSIHSAVKPKAVLVVGGLVALGVGGYLAYHAYQEGLPRLTAFQPAPPPAAKQIVHYERNWEKLPPAAAYAQSCEDLFTELSPAGWSLLKFECAGTTATGDFERGTSRLMHLVSLLPDATVDATGDKASWRQVMQLPPGAADDLWDWTAIHYPLRDVLQSLKVTYKLGPARMPQPPQIPPQDVDKVEIVPPFWREYPFAIGPIAMPPHLFIGLLDLPGARFSKIVYQKGFWGYEGIIYAK